MTERTDAELLSLYQTRGDHNAFDALVTRYRGLVYATCRRWIQDRTEVEDVTQAVFLILYQKAPRLHGKQRLASWLYKTCQLTAQNHLRNAATRQKQEAQLMQETLQHNHSEEDALWSRIDTDLNEALNSLKPPDREAILLRYLVGLSVQEVGEAMKVSESAAQMRLHRAIERLRRWFAGQGITLSAAGLAALLAARGTEASPIAPTLSAKQPSATAVSLAKGTITQMRNIMLIKMGLTALLTLSGTLSISWAVQQLQKPELLDLKPLPVTTALQPVTAQTPILEQIITQIEKSEKRLQSFEATLTSGGGQIPVEEVRVGYAAADNYWGYRNYQESVLPAGSNSATYFEGNETFQVSDARLPNGTITQQATHFTGKIAADRGTWRLNSLQFGALSTGGFAISRTLKAGKYAVMGSVRSADYGTLYVVSGTDSLVGPNSLDQTKNGRVVPEKGIDTRIVNRHTFWIAPKFGWLSVLQKEGDSVLKGERLPKNVDYRATRLARYGDVWVPVAGVMEQSGAEFLRITARDVKVNQTSADRFHWKAPAGVTVQEYRP